MINTLLFEVAIVSRRFESLAAIGSVGCIVRLARLARSLLPLGAGSTRAHGTRGWT